MIFEKKTYLKKYNNITIPRTMLESKTKKIYTITRDTETFWVIGSVWFLHI